MTDPRIEKFTEALMAATQVCCESPAYASRQSAANAVVLALYAEALAVKVPDALPVPEPFAGTMGAVHERGFAVGWNACRDAMLTTEAVSSVDYWQKRGHVCRICNGTGVHSYRQADHLGGQYVDTPCKCAAPPTTLVTIEAERLAELERDAARFAWAAHNTALTVFKGTSGKEQSNLNRLRKVVDTFVARGAK